MTPGRLQCTRCLRPESNCICRWITPTLTEADVLILQHPLEVHQAKGSARLLHLSLSGSRLVTGEAFDPLALQNLLDTDHRVNLLLYPGDAEGCHPDPLPTEPSQIRLVVLDGTWRKSRKMLHLNPALRQLPRLALQAPPPSRYLIRKAHRPDQLSTLEATCLALQQLQKGPSVQFEPLLAAFAGFVASQRR
ncbi:tRNA-uridine aminocarboxypropyltransferase [Aquabacterium sp.]|uniref:tRNA-uridine aminocarboxypropyltransferase n=1 Tax=Aquabacterium sp. TaxID=1872578 RepID=UPI0025BE1522|nr:tRNA-uridine aminocarboxypropyltransferase [Aquabacterium sp.]